MFPIITFSFLIEQIRNGDDSAFTELIQPHIAKAYRTAYYILSSRDSAEEVVQKSMIEAYNNIVSGKKIRNFPSWFTNLVCCRSIDMARQRTKQQKSTVDLEGIYIKEDSSTLETIIVEEKKKKVNDAIMSLENSSYQTVLILYYYHDLKISEIATILDLNPSTVKTHLNRAKQSLSKNTQLREYLGVN